MWGKWYWGRREEKAEGVVVVFAWLSSEEWHLRQFVRLYGSLGWNSLVCHSDFLTLFFPNKATSLANGILTELTKETKVRQLPVVFAAFSGGPKACMYKVLQIIDGKCEGKGNADDYQLVKDCLCGQIYDSSPVDFKSDFGARFVLHPTVIKMEQPPRVLSWTAKAIASTLDTLFLERFEAQRAEYWQALYSSVSYGPFLIFCSEDDQLAPYDVVSSFARRLQELGADVKLVKKNTCPHVGHYKNYPDDYRACVTELLNKASVIYFQRRHKGNGGGCNPITKSVFDLHKAAMSSNKSLRRVAVGPSDHFFLPSSVEYHETGGAGSVQDEQKGTLFQYGTPPTTNAHGVLGKILFDACVPKSIEGWDLKPGSLRGKQIVNPDGRRGHYNPIRCLRRSRL